MNLSLHDLAELTGGELRLAATPPRDGELTLVKRFVLTAETAGAEDVFWCLARHACNVELAFLRGALGVVSAGRAIEPWPGRFSLQVDDSVEALRRLVAGLSVGWEQSFNDPPELKVLQLCAAGGVDIYAPTCGQSAKGHWARRCRRQAA
jgi:hypothetical protein